MDVTGGGPQELLLLSGGALVARAADDTILWRTPALELLRIGGQGDLDGDGVQEIIVGTVNRVHVVHSRTGAVVWSLPTGTLSALGAVRIADLNGDDNLDLYVSDAACGALNSHGDVAEAWSFVSDIAVPTRLFQLERGRRDYVCGKPDTIADVTGDGQLEVIVQGTRFLYVYSGVNGSLISASESIGPLPYASARVEAANLDGDAGIELILYTDSAYAPAGSSRRVLMMDWDPAAERMVRRWERSVVDVINDRHAFGASAPGGSVTSMAMAFSRSPPVSTMRPSTFGRRQCSMRAPARSSHRSPGDPSGGSSIWMATALTR